MIDKLLCKVYHKEEVVLGDILATVAVLGLVLSAALIVTDFDPIAALMLILAMSGVVFLLLGLMLFLSWADGFVIARCSKDK